ncbi:ABC transporter substrate-binding protein [Ruania halotolerans]|uniref:ABC transporter substrate-binding protein n=1 Tax=Ruania halotolerans TaxID=2897773 RepID=UPI001E52B702|nr:ABC transporter substrate-binding protein [Ruania halotolerans]UFU07989.1 ABC transporter substrate-binding protein [Ruania halotolerans]
MSASLPQFSPTRRGVLLGLAAAGAVGLSACSGGSSPRDEPSAPAGDGGASGYDGPNVELAFWNGFTGGDGPMMLDLVDRFNTEHENIAVTMSTMQWADYYSRLPSAVSSGNGPDIGIMHVDSVATNAARNVIQPLDDVAAALNLQEGDFAPVPWAAGIYDGQRFAIPLDVHPLGFYYNKTVMADAGLDPEAPPSTLDDYMSALDTLKGAGIQGHWASPFPFTGGLSVQSLTYQFGGSLFNEDGTAVVWDDQAGVDALSWWVSLISEGYSPDNVDQDAEYVALKNGSAAFNWNGIWQINDLKQSDIEWGVAPLPVIGSQPGVWAGSHQFVLPVQRSEDENKATASRVFLNWISQQSLEWAEAGQVPARNEVRESAEFEALTEQATLASQIDDLHFPPTVPGISDCMAEFDKALNEAVLEGKDPQTALSDAAGRATQILEENAERYGA